VTEKGIAISDKMNARLEEILKTATVVGESERAKTDVKTSSGKLASVDVPFLVSYITQLEAVVTALRQEKSVMEVFDKAIADKDEETLAKLSKQVLESGRAVEKTLEDLDHWHLILE